MSPCRHRPRLLAALALGEFLVGSGAGCEGGPTPLLSDIEPGQGYSDQHTQILLRGSGFLPGLDLDLDQHANRTSATGFNGRIGDQGVGVEIRNFQWLDAEHLIATVDSGLPLRLQPYAITITDPRGATSVLPSAFYSLGPDHAPPQLDIKDPAIAMPLAPGAEFPVHIVAWDPNPGSLSQVRWQTRGAGQLLQQDFCRPIPGEVRTVCAFNLIVPDSLHAQDAFELSVIATDSSAIGNQASESRSYRLHERPVLLSITPDQGSMRGGNDVLITGQQFPPGTRILVGGVPLLPDGGVQIDGGTITGKIAPSSTPGLAPIVVDVTLVAPTGKSTLPQAFRYLPGPGIADVQPATAPAAGGIGLRIRGTALTPETRVYFGTKLAGAVPLDAPMFVSDQEIRGVAPPGVGVTRVWVADPALGNAVWSGRFTWTALP